jgi:GNAT superfamily N-acetyltransferase
MSQITIKECSTGELDQFYKFFETSIRNLFPQYTTNIKNFLINVDYPLTWLKDQHSKGRKIIYLAKDDGKIIGFLFANNVYAGVGFAVWLATHPDYQKRGVASNLLKTFEKRMLKDGAHVLQLWTTKPNLTFYKNRGFTKSGEFPNSWFGNNTYLMIKQLRKAQEKNYLKEYLNKQR